MNYDEYFLEYIKKLGNNIQKLRKKRNISINELSEKTGIRAEYLKKIENGKAYRVTLNRHLSKIANVLNIKLFELLKI